MKIFETDSKISIEFNSIIEVLENNPTRNLWKYKKILDKDIRKMSRKDKEVYNGFYGPTANSTKEIINKAIVGDAEMYNKYVLGMKGMIDNKINGVNIKESDQVVKTKRRKFINSDFGDEVDINKINQGQISTAWRKPKTFIDDARHNLITLVVDISGILKMSAMDSIWTSAVVEKIYEDIVKNGKSVKIIAISAAMGVYENCDKITTTSILIKDYNQPLCKTRLASMTHLGFHRTFNFLARCFNGNYNVSDGLGISFDVNKNFLPHSIDNEMLLGHTKPIIINKAMSYTTAINVLSNIENNLL